MKLTTQDQCANMHIAEIVSHNAMSCSLNIDHNDGVEIELRILVQRSGEHNSEMSDAGKRKRRRAMIASGAKQTHLKPSQIISNFVNDSTVDRKLIPEAGQISKKGLPKGSRLQKSTIGLTSWRGLLRSMPMVTSTSRPVSCQVRKDHTQFSAL